jgi:hypothetical protein
MKDSKFLDLFLMPPKIDIEKAERTSDAKQTKWRKENKGSSSSFSGCGTTAPAKYIRNYWPLLEWTPTLKTRSSTGLPALSQVTQAAKTFCDLAGP